MYHFFCRSNYPINISRQVKLFVKLTYYLLSHVCGIPVVCIHYVFFVCFQSGGGGRKQGAAAEAETAVRGQEEHGVGKVVLVGKFLCIV